MLIAIFSRPTTDIFSTSLNALPSASAAAKILRDCKPSHAVRELSCGQSIAELMSTGT